MSGTPEAPTYDQPPAPRKEWWVTYRYIHFSLNKLNSVWSGMCLRKKRPTLQSVSGQNGTQYCFRRTCKGFVHRLNRRTFIPFARSDCATLGKSTSYFCLWKWEELPFAAPCCSFSHPEETQQWACGNHMKSRSHECCRQSTEAIPSFSCPQPWSDGSRVASPGWRINTSPGSGWARGPRWPKP